MLNSNKFMASIILINHVYAAFASLLGTHSLITGIFMGFSAIISSDLAKLVIRNEVKLAKRYIIVSLVIIFILCSMIGSVLIIFRKNIGILLNNDERSQQSITEFIIPFTCYEFTISGVHMLNGICRAIGKDKIIVVVLALGFVVVQPVSWVLLKFCLNVGDNSFFLAMGIGCGFICICELFVIFKATFYKKADTLISGTTCVNDEDVIATIKSSPNEINA